ncbi:MAG: TetR/AcrR family transcriptional regulator [Fusobacteriaceae bacterium]
MKSKKNYIKRLATIMFGYNGIKNTTIRDIARNCNIALGGLYYYYKSKEHLLSEITAEALQSRQKFLTTLNQSDSDFKTKCRKIISRRITLNSDRAYLFLFANLDDNYESNLSAGSSSGRDLLFEDFLSYHKEYIKDEYIKDIPKIGQIISSASKRHLLLLIESTNIKIDDEDSFNAVIDKFQDFDMEKETEFFFNLFFKEFIK